MSLIDLSKTGEVHTATAEERYLWRHYEALYLQRRARDQERHRPRAEPVELESIPPDEQSAEPERIHEVKADVLQAPGRITTPERRQSLQDMARRMGAKRRQRPSKP